MAERILQQEQIDGVTIARGVTESGAHFIAEIWMGQEIRVPATNLRDCINRYHALKCEIYYREM